MQYLNANIFVEFEDVILANSTKRMIIECVYFVIYKDSNVMDFNDHF